MSTDVFRKIWREAPRPALISVHRGLWSQAPENSVAAIRAAQGYGIIEIDAQLASDGVPVVIHDPDLMRTAGQTTKVGDTPHNVLTSQPLLTGYGGQEARLTQAKIPTLQEALAAAGPNDYFDIDVKFPHEVEAVAAALAETGQQSRGSLKIDTKTPQDISNLLALQNKYGVMVMAKVVISEAGLDHIRDLTQVGVAAAEVWYDSLDQLAEACRIGGADMAISTYTLDPVHCCGLSDDRAKTDPDAVWGALLDAGVSIIMSDLAPELAAYMDQRG